MTLNTGNVKFFLSDNAEYAKIAYFPKIKYATFRELSNDIVHLQVDNALKMV